VEACSPTRKRGVYYEKRVAVKRRQEARRFCRRFTAGICYIIYPTLTRGATCFHRFAVIKYVRKRCVQLQGQVTALQILYLLPIEFGRLGGADQRTKRRLSVFSEFKGMMASVANNVLHPGAKAVLKILSTLNNIPTFWTTMILKY